MFTTFLQLFIFSTREDFFWKDLSNVIFGLAFWNGSIKEDLGIEDIFWEIFLSSSNIYWHFTNLKLVLASFYENYALLEYFGGYLLKLWRERKRSSNKCQILRGAEKLYFVSDLPQERKKHNNKRKVIYFTSTKLPCNILHFLHFFSWFTNLRFKGNMGQNYHW